MKYCRSFASAASDGDFVYVVGGEDENGRKLSSIERYDVKNDRWMVLTKMRRGGKVGVAVAVIDSMLYMVGGYNKELGHGPILSDVECYHLSKNRCALTPILSKQ